MLLFFFILYIFTLFFSFCMCVFIFFILSLSLASVSLPSSAFIFFSQILGFMIITLTTKNNNILNRTNKFHTDPCFKYICFFLSISLKYFIKTKQFSVLLFYLHYLFCIIIVFNVLKSNILLFFSSISTFFRHFKLIFFVIPVVNRTKFCFFFSLKNSKQKLC